jgi:protein tyrosine phosphatase
MASHKKRHSIKKMRKLQKLRKSRKLRNSVKSRKATMRKTLRGGYRGENLIDALIGAYTHKFTDAETIDKYELIKKRKRTTIKITILDVVFIALVIYLHLFTRMDKIDTGVKLMIVTVVFNICTNLETYPSNTDFTHIFDLITDNIIKYFNTLLQNYGYSYIKLEINNEYKTPAKHKKVEGGILEPLNFESILQSYLNVKNSNTVDVLNRIKYFFNNDFAYNNYRTTLFDQIDEKGNIVQIGKIVQIGQLRKMMKCLKNKDNSLISPPDNNNIFSPRYNAIYIEHKSILEELFTYNNAQFRPSEVAHKKPSKYKKGKIAAVLRDANPGSARSDQIDMALFTDPIPPKVLTVAEAFPLEEITPHKVFIHNGFKVKLYQIGNYLYNENGEEVTNNGERVHTLQTRPLARKNMSAHATNIANPTAREETHGTYPIELSMALPPHVLAERNRGIALKAASLAAASGYEPSLGEPIRHKLEATPALPARHRSAAQPAHHISEAEAELTFEPRIRSLNRSAALSAHHRSEAASAAQPEAEAPAAPPTHRRSSKNTPETPETPDEHTLTHYWFKAWPDHGVPEMNKFITLLDILYDDITNNPGTTVIHCSAGVGRTGVLYVALKLILDNHSLLEYIKDPDATPGSSRASPTGSPVIRRRSGTLERPARESSITLDATGESSTDTYPTDKEFKQLIESAISGARNARNKYMVQQPVQYLFLLMLFKIIDRDDYIEEYNALPKPKNSKSVSDRNHLKNRYQDIPAFDSGRVSSEYLPGMPKSENYYINASVLPNGGKEHFIGAQCPKDPDTIEDFNNMLAYFSPEIKRVVMLTGLFEMSDGKLKEKCSSYLPTENKHTKLKNNTELPNKNLIERREVKVSKNHDNAILELNKEAFYSLPLEEHTSFNSIHSNA